MGQAVHYTKRQQWVCSTCQKEIPASEILSPREFQILLEYAKGKQATQMAREMFLSIKTISTHLMRIRAKLGVSTTRLLLIYAWEHGLMSGDSSKGCVHHK